MATENSKGTYVDPEKILAERLNGYAAITGCIALVGAYVST